MYGKLGSPNMVGCAAISSTYNEPMEDVKCRPEVAQALDDLRSVVERYDGLVGRLSSKLGCVTVPAPPVGSDHAEKGYQTELANIINQSRCMLRDITDNLESLYQRIEL